MTPLPTSDEAPTVPLWPTAANAVGIKGKRTAYDLAPTGQLCEGVRILRISGRWRVPTSELRRVLGLDPQATAS